MLGQDAAVSLGAERMQQLGRALYIGEQERDLAAREPFSCYLNNEKSLPVVDHGAIPEATFVSCGNVTPDGPMYSRTDSAISSPMA